MCIVIGKYFKKLGWIAIKNRDRNYVPEISFRRKTKDGVEIMYFWDDITWYSEGFNSAGVGVLGASLMVLDDEKEIKSRTKEHSKDGKRIRKALQYPDVKAVAMSLIKDKLTGNTLVFDKDNMYLIESAYNKGEYHSVIKEIPHDQTIVRTNHGVWLPWAGYQRDEKKKNEWLSRISSESRRLIAMQVANDAQDPEEIMDNLVKNYTNNGQLNALRTSGDKKKMRTTSQIMIIPQEKTMYVRPVQSHLNFDFWKMNDPKQQTWVEILSNRILYSHIKGHPEMDPPFAHLDHSTD